MEKFVPLEQFSIYQLYRILTQQPHKKILVKPIAFSALNGSSVTSFHGSCNRSRVREKPWFWHQLTKNIFLWARKKKVVPSSHKTYKISSKEWKFIKRLLLNVNGGTFYNETNRSLIVSIPSAELPSVWHKFSLQPKKSKGWNKPLNLSLCSLFLFWSIQITNIVMKFLWSTKACQHHKTGVPNITRWMLKNTERT